MKKPVSRQRLWQLEQAKKGLCALCATPAVEGYVHCQKHIDACVVRHRNRRKKLMDLGLCLHCEREKEPHRMAKIMCVQCAENQLNYQRQYQKKLKHRRKVDSFEELLTQRLTTKTRP